MADPFEIVKNIAKTGKAINDALVNMRRNKEDCEDIEVLVRIIMAILSQLEKVDLRIHPAMCSALEFLNTSLGRALKIVNAFQERNVMYRLVTAKGMAKKLRRVNNDILQKMQLGNFAMTMEISITTIVRHDGFHALPTQPQEAVELEMYSSYSNTGLAKFSLSKTVTTHQFSEENNNRGRSYTTVYKQKIVIKMAMSCDKSRAKAMSLVAATDGVDSVGIAGDGKDQVIIVGEGLDVIKLTAALHRKVGRAQLMQVSSAQEDMQPAVEAQWAVVGEEEEQQQEPATTRRPRARSSGIRAITAKFCRFIWRRPRNTTSRPAPLPLLIDPASPLLTMAEDLSTTTAVAAPRTTPAARG